MEANDQSNNLTTYLSKFVTDHKKQVIEAVLANRTRHITVVLENIYHPHNASAVLRTCEALGIQDIHIIEAKNQYKINQHIVRGSSKWVTLHQYSESTDKVKDCFGRLKKSGYRVIGTIPDPKLKTVSDMDTTQKYALVFGTEESGLSDDARTAVDDTIQIPLYGFTKSLNISVAAGIILNDLVSRLRQSGTTWCLNETEKEELRLCWFKNLVKNADIHEKEFLRLQSSQ